MQKPWKRGEALSGTRTPDPLLTMEGNGRNGGTRPDAADRESPAPAGNRQGHRVRHLTPVDASFTGGCAQGVPTIRWGGPSVFVVWAALGVGTWAVLAGVGFLVWWLS